jgi:inositol-polyphosphate multikinase
LSEGIARFFPVGSKETGGQSLGLPISLLLPILHGVRQDVVEIRDAIASLEVRMVGSSLLIIYEADWSRAEEALKRMEEDIEEELEDEDSGDEEELEDEDSEDEEILEAPYVVKLIDFAHTRLTPGRGRDEGVLTGINTVISLIDGRINELTSVID